MNLTELQKANPGLYSVIREYSREHSPDDPRYNDIIQGCLQRAIETRGWNWNLNETDKRYCAMIASFKSVYDGFSDSPAEALLSAYCEAIHES